MIRIHKLPSFMGQTALAVALSATMASAASAQDRPVALRDSFPIGSNDGILCQVQDRSLDNKAKAGIFDRSWAVVCRDSARPVGRVFAFRNAPDDMAARISAQRPDTISCSGDANTQGDVTKSACRLTDEPVAYSVFSARDGNVTYQAEGLSAYDDATLLAMKSIMSGKIAEGKIDVASTSIEDPFAFARVQAATLKPEQALAEGYRRNLSGDYAEAAAFFETLQQRTANLKEGENREQINAEEYIINRALQKSNLGEYAEADRLFDEARDITINDAVTERLLRNFETMHFLNQNDFARAQQRIIQPVNPIAREIRNREAINITQPISSRINGAASSVNLLSFTDELKLTPAERAEIIDAQALQLRGTIKRIEGNYNDAENLLSRGYNDAIAVRDGRVTSIVRLRAQILSELSALAEVQGDYGSGESRLREALDLLEVQYPETRAVNGAKARLAAYLLRRGNETEARGLYAQVVDSSLGKRAAVSGMANQIAPYFRLLANDDSASAEFFRAGQILVRPGVAETQAVLSRELSGGSDEASRLFRQSVNLSRNIEKLRIRLAALAKVEPSASSRNAQAELSGEIETLERSQQLTQVKLNEFPQYRAVASSTLNLDELRSTMQPGEAYTRLSVVGEDLFMFYTDADYSAAYPLNLSASELDEKVDFIRASISVQENGQYVTYPFEIAAAHELYTTLFGPVETRLAAQKHLIFEPDGAMLRLPINLLVADAASVAAYNARLESPDGDPYNFTGVNWLGRDLDISTAVSAKGFADARSAPASTATRQYLGMGQNQPVLADTNIGTLRINMNTVRNTGVRGAIASGNGTAEACTWPLNEWNKPIDAAELSLASSIVGDGNSQILTGGEFTDANILSKSDISNYRILHFATHGLVTPPQPSCPAKPALLTSFGGDGSDGLLAFDEIFDLRLNADIVILSACDTAGKASITATREAGVSSGGGTALDGLVRSFIGAGGRSVLASHWPAPDDYQATERLISGLFSDGKGRSIADALRFSQAKLMEDPLTSHPYYWSGFAIIGDGERLFLPGSDVAATGKASKAAALK